MEPLEDNVIAKKPSTNVLAAVGEVPDARSATRRAVAAAERRELHECMGRHPSGRRRPATKPAEHMP
jgi:hypothetical protein